MAALVAGRPQESPVQILETPAGPGSGMYALTPQHRPYRDGRFTEPEPILSWIDPLPEGGHALRFATLQGDRWSEPREVARGTNWFANWADHPSVVWAGGGDDMLAHWLVRAGNGTSKYGYGVRIARSTDGGRQWTPLFSAEPEDTQDYAGFVAFSTVTPVPGAAYLAPAAGQVAHASPAPEGHHAEGRKALVYTHFMPDGRAVTDVLDPDTCSCCNVATAFAGGRPHRRLSRPHARRRARHLDRSLERPRLDRADDGARRTDGSSRAARPTAPPSAPTTTAWPWRGSRRQGARRTCGSRFPRTAARHSVHPPTWTTVRRSAGQAWC